MIGRKTVLALGNMVVGSALGLVALFLVGRFFGPEANGEMTFAVSVLGLLFFLTDLGMAQAHVKRVSEGRDPGDCFATYAVFKLVATGVFVSLALLAFWFYVFVVGRTIEDTSLAALVLALVFYIAKAIQDIGQSSFEARVETAKAQLTGFVDTVVRVGLTALFAGVLAATASGIGPFARFATLDHPIIRWIHENPGAALTLTMMLGGIAAAFASVTMLMRAFERGRFRWELLRDYWTFALPLFLTSTVAILATNVDGAALGYFLGKEDAGVFGAIRRIPVVLQGVGVAVGILLFPTISAMAARGDHDGIKRSMDRAIRYLSMMLVPIVTFVLLFAEPIIRISISDAFVSGAPALRVLSVYVIIVTLGYAHGTLLLGLGKPKIAARMGIINAILIIGLDLVLIPNDIRSIGLRLGGLGVIGAAIGTLVAATVWYTGLRIANWRLAGYKEGGHVWKHILAAAGMALVLLAVDHSIVAFARWFHVPIYALLGAAAYAGGLALLRELTREDLRFLVETTHPGEMFTYIRDELRPRRK